MRFMDVATYAFTDTTGRTLTVKEMREIPAYNVMMSMARSPNDDMDEIASRQYVYGPGAEMNAYKLHEANMAQLLDARFDMARVLSIKVPS